MLSIRRNNILQSYEYNTRGQIIGITDGDRYSYEYDRNGNQIFKAGIQLDITGTAMQKWEWGCREIDSPLLYEEMLL